MFLSHVTENKQVAIAIGEYIKNAGLDIYLDIYDSELQRAVSSGDDKAITQCIENGINASTDILCIVSETTKRSWWVPFEIGYGKRAEKSVSTLLLKDVIGIPSYLAITNLIQGTKKLNQYSLSLHKRETTL
ncbi:toll/interleukin-1 receptor domain-containing protein [Bacillus wiedmannii]|uniref:toll/interleukin-1 receptor domain-containing protein n=1 Tax=Bacillus wiedmannii TaxID=1890302 RepID=UPI00211D2AE9|nr:toll/interleukin-1 receptor domain-containing protein [Bacillus wiedmannii]